MASSHEDHFVRYLPWVMYNLNGGIGDDACQTEPGSSCAPASGTKKYSPDRSVGQPIDGSYYIIISCGGNNNEMQEKIRIARPAEQDCFALECDPYLKTNQGVSGRARNQA